MSTTTNASSSEEEASSVTTTKRNQVIVSPSIAKANLWDLKQCVERVIEGGAEWLHVSVQDGSSYAPKISLGSPTVRCLRTNVSLEKNVKIDVKLNTQEPMDRIEEFVSAGADVITFAPEAAKQPMAVLQKIKHSAKQRERDILAGIVLNPSTGLYTIEELRPYCDVVVVMLVNPGLGTTPYKTLDEKIKRVRNVREYFGPATRVQIDGGVDERSAKELIKAGADTIVAGAHFQIRRPGESHPRFERRRRRRFEKRTSSPLAEGEEFNRRDLARARIINAKNFYIYYAKGKRRKRKKKSAVSTLYHIHREPL